MRKPNSPFQYPVVLRQHLNFMTISVPDLGISLIEEMPEQKRLNKDYVTRIGLKVAEAWLKAQKIINEKSGAKKFLPYPSMTKESIRAPEKDLSPQKMAQLVGVSKCTVIRDCKKGIIRSRRTSGGHFKIPVAQLGLYQAYLKQHIKHATDNWLKIALEKLQSLDD
jgi:hypothetical protein